MYSRVLFLTLMLFSTSVTDAGFYTRWGRTTCSNHAYLVYSGYMASGFGNNTGAGRNYICLTTQPKWGNVKLGTQTFTSPLYGVVYAIGNKEGYNNQPFSWTNFNSQDPSTTLAVCAVCETQNRQNTGSSVVTVYGTSDCPGALSTEYRGYLAAGWLRHVGAPDTVTGGYEWICLDSAPESSGPKLTYFHAILHVAEIACGSLPCSTYPKGNEVSCAVCSH